METSRTHIQKKIKIKKKSKKIKKQKELMEKNRFHESKKEIQAYRVSSIATRPFHCEVIKATSIKKQHMQSASQHMQSASQALMVMSNATAQPFRDPA